MAVRLYTKKKNQAGVQVSGVSGTQVHAASISLPLTDSSMESKASVLCGTPHPLLCSVIHQLVLQLPREPGLETGEPGVDTAGLGYLQRGGSAHLPEGVGVLGWSSCEPHQRTERWLS